MPAQARAVVVHASIVRGACLGRRGRKRKSGRRHPSGGLVAAERFPDDQVRASRQPHRRGLDVDDRLSEKAESAFGRLFLAGRISEQQHEAGLRYAAVVGSYRAVIGAPRSVSGSGHGFECVIEDPTETRERVFGLVMTVRRGACWDDDEPCPCRRRKAHYDAAFEHLMAVGQRAAKMVSRVAVHGEELPDGFFVYLVAGLNALAAHFGLTERRRGSSLRNA